MSGRVSSAPRSEGRLRERRRRARRRFLYALGVLFLLLVAAALYAVQQPAVRIARVEVFGSPAPLDTLAQEAMQGRYVGIVPRDSIFFYPERVIRARIIERYGDIATVSFFRNGLTGLTIRATYRVPIARWCGADYLPPTSSSTPAMTDCYLFDDSGLLFATSTEVALVNPFIIYGPLQDPSASVRGQVLPAAHRLPAVLNFAREIASLGSPTVAIVLAAPEATLALESGTRVVYVLGQEQEAYTALVSAKDTINLADGSLEYLDLRFSGKVYLKRRGSGEQGQ